MKFVIRRQIDGQYYFKIVASNGETLAHSEGYRSKQSAKNAIDLIRRYAGSAVVSDLAAA
ncbi:MAG: YegP family protein [Aeromicrobium erythreum]